MDIQIRWAIKVISLLVSSFQSSKIYNNHRQYHPPPTTTELTPCIIEALRSCSNKNQHRLWFDYHSIHTFVLFFIIYSFLLLLLLFTSLSYVRWLLFFLLHLHTIRSIQKVLKSFLLFYKPGYYTFISLYAFPRTIPL